MTTKTSSRRMLGALLACCWVACQPDGQQPIGQSPDDVIQVSFAQVESDDLVRRTVGEEAVIGSVRMWHGGLNIDYRPVHAAGAADILAGARQQLEAALSHALEANANRLNARFARVGQDALGRDSCLRDELNSLLNVRQVFLDGLTAARSGAPLTYAVEVSSTQGTISGQPGMATIRSVPRDTRNQAPGPSLPSVYARSSPLSAVPPRDLETLMRALASLRPTDDRGRLSAGEMRNFAPTPVVPAWWPQQGDFFYDGDLYTDSYMKWLTIDPERGAGDELAPGYEHSLAIDKNFLQGCMAITTLPNPYSQCARTDWSQMTSFDLHHVGTHDLGALELRKTYVAIYSFSARGSNLNGSQNRLIGHRTRRRSGCDPSPCVEPLRSAWYISRGRWILQHGSARFLSWVPVTVWPIPADGSTGQSPLPDEE
jgi:hypothetical protein